MRRVRYALPLLFAVAPALAHAQLVLDSVHVEVADGVYPSYVYSEVTIPDTLGPIPLVLVEGDGTTAPPSHGCDPLVNADEVADAIALVERGTCAFLTKVQRAVDAGAVAVVIALNGTADPDYIGPPVLCGDCPPWEAAGPLLLVSYNSGQAILAELASGPTDVTLVPVRIASPVVAEEATQAGAFVLHPAYPNPLASHATIGLDLPTAQAVRVAVFDMLGREVAVLHEGPLAVGPHTLTLDASALSAGLYLVRATGAGHRATRKLVITRYNSRQ